MKLITLLFITFSLLILSACGETEYTYDSASYFAQDWESSYTKISDCNKSGQHGGDYVKVFADAKAAPAYQGDADVAEGGVIIKPQYIDDACTELSSITVMRKGAEGTATDSGNWQWQRVKDDGSIDSEGQIGACISCHTGCGGNSDYRCQK